MTRADGAPARDPGEAPVPEASAPPAASTVPEAPAVPRAAAVPETLAFLFTDVEGSTRMWTAHPDEMGCAIRRHERLIGEAVTRRGGRVFKTVGDALCASFRAAGDALAAALDAQRELAREAWALPGGMRVRMAVHAGAAERAGDDYLGPTLNRTARILAAGHGGQVLLSPAAAELVADRLPPGARLRDLGEHRLKDLPEPLRIFQLVAPGIEAEFPALRSLDARRVDLPVQPTPLIGREAEVREVGERLLAPGVRLVTLTGPGGTGKTRLALETAARMAEDFESGVQAVFLAPIRDPTLVVATIARSLGLRDAGERGPLEELIEHLRGRRLLLVLDNFEHVIPASTDVARLLAATEEPKVLVTSREPLRVSGEHELPVMPLALPPAGASVESLTSAPAVELFLERARAVSPGFRLTTENAAAVSEVCRKLDGLPLAIELAAARVRLLPPAALAARLGRRLDLLTSGPRDLPDRQRTLRGAIDWSHDLLDEGERAVFRRLAAFVSSASLSGAEAVCGAPAGRGGPAFDVLERLESLVAKSLVRQVGEPDGDPRFGMLETIREYAAERLAESEDELEVRRRHAAHVLEVVEREDAALREGEQSRALAALELEQDELRQALAWTLAAGELETAAELATTAWMYWWVHGDLSEGRGFLGVVLERGERLPDVVRARLMTRMGGLAYIQGDLDAAAATLEPAVELARRSGDEIEISRAMGNLGTVRSERGEFEAAQALFEEALALNRARGDRRATAYTLGNLGVMASFRGEFERARELHEESLAILRAEGDTHRVPLALINVGVAETHLGDFDRAAEVLRESLEISLRVGARHVQAHSHTNLGHLARVRGDLAGAREHLREALAMSRELGQRREIASALAALAVVERLEGQPERAARLGSLAESMRAAQRIDLGVADLGWSASDAAAVRGELGDVAFERARSWAAAAALEEALDYAMSRDSP